MSTKKKTTKKTTTSSASSQTHENGKLVAILSYIFIGLIWYALDAEVRKDAFARFHFKQGIVLLITIIILSIAASILSWIVGWWLHTLVQIVDLILIILGIVAAVNGEEKELPVIGQYAKKI